MASENIVQFDDAWESFLDRFPPDDALAQMTQTELERHLGLRDGVLEKFAAWSIQAWRDSPSTSLLNGLWMFSDTHGVPCDDIFPGLLEQTRFLRLLGQRHVLGTAGWDYVRDKSGKPRKVTDSDLAMTATPFGARKINDIVRILYACHRRNQALTETKTVRTPSVLYRGIRFRDLWRHPQVKAQIRDLDRKGYYHGRKADVDAALRAIARVPLVDLMHAPVLSFTETRRVAEYFADNEGLVVAVPTQGLPAKIVTSHKHDANLAGPDPIKGKLEKEWILLVDSGFTLSMDNVAVQDLDYQIATGNPLCVGMFDGRHVQAEYSLDGHKVVATFHYKTERTGALSFCVDGRFPESRRETIRLLGFDPLPKADNLDRVENFRLFDYDRFFGRRKLLDIPGGWEPPGGETSSLGVRRP